MAFQYNIPELLKGAFGISGVRSYSEIPRNIPFYVTGYNDIPPVEVNQENATSHLGTPIVMPVAFGEVRWNALVDGVKKSFSLPEITLPPALMIDFNQPVIREKTKVAGRNGSVKEYIGLDDWSIRVRGIIINEESDTPPEAGIKALKALKNCPVAIPILNDMCEWLDIYDVVIDDIEFTSLEGYPGAQPFILTMSSDEVFELKYKKGL